MKKAPLYAYPLLVFGWLVCLQYDEPPGLNVPAPYLWIPSAKNAGTAKQEMQVVRAPVADVITICCSNAGTTALYTALVSDSKIRCNQAIVYNYRNHSDKGTCCFNRY